MATVALERIHQQHICPSEDQRSLDVEKEGDIIATDQDPTCDISALFKVHPGQPLSQNLISRLNIALLSRKKGWLLSGLLAVGESF